MPKDPDDRYRYIRLAGSLGTIPVLLGVGPLLGYFFGQWLDGKLGTSPWLSIVFLALGFAAAIRSIVRLIKQVQKDLDKM